MRDTLVFSDVSREELERIVKRIRDGKTPVTVGDSEDGGSELFIDDEDGDTDGGDTSLRQFKPGKNNPLIPRSEREKDKEKL